MRVCEDIRIQSLDLYKNRAHNQFWVDQNETKKTVSLMDQSLSWFFVHCSRWTLFLMIGVIMEISAIEVLSCPKSRQILDDFCPLKFYGGRPQKLYPNFYTYLAYLWHVAWKSFVGVTPVFPMLLKLLQTDHLYCFFYFSRSHFTWMHWKLIKAT